MCDYCFAVWTYTHSLSLSCRSVRAPLGNFTEDNALDEWRYDCSQLHRDIFFLSKTSIYYLKLWHRSAEMTHSWKKNSFLLWQERCDQKKKRRDSKKQNVWSCLRNGLQQWASQVDSQWVLILAAFCHSVTFITCTYHKNHKTEPVKSDLYLE